MNELTVVFLLAVVASVGLQWWLAQRHIKTVQAHQYQVPALFAEKISLAEHQKAATYTQVKTRFAQKMLLLETGILLVWTLGGGLAWLDQSWRTLAWSPLWTGVAVIMSFMLISSLLDIPLSWYRTFRIESMFGFNRMSISTFIGDTLKGLGLSLVIGLPLLTLVLWLMEVAGAFWWLWVWLVWLGFTFLMLLIYPTFIAPLFNKFKPLEDGELKQRISQLLQRNGFANDGIFVMDGSKRSGHGNAYFTGLGKHKRIVFFDTLLEGLNTDEVEAVLAHEVGHFKHNHIHKRLVWMGLLMLGSLALLGWLMQQAFFYQAFQIADASTYMALLLFMLIMPVFTFFLSPLMAWAARKHEFEADSFATQQAQSEALVHALVKLYRENANTLTPDPLYSAFYDSHPPAPVRIAHLNMGA
ncbi:Zn-dependent protease with chaperone function [Beggiatoa alba B18LD]|uniref:Zn-dependent protease with chaperone function n=1 Tax=Beggiatoa alba B18LD TaxID=395493 RepID=I3CDV0_9GAMM|nr:M48 family metallopeptidase [Beggiatoa alba]EIJ41793.1 Zn-dependent protease with chaperone function [Beggiatoa alba B18LD]